METILGLRDRLDRFTRLVATIGFTGLVVMAMMTMSDASMRYLGLPRIPGFSDLGEVIYAVVIASCFPAGLLQGHNITIRFLGKGLGQRGGAWLETFGASVTMLFFSMLAWQFLRLTLDYQANDRVTGTIEMSIAPWWWVTTAIIAMCLPVQFLVLVQRLTTAVTGRGEVPTGVGM
ncbi:MAG: TRAP transporter small permease subunit, partial [Alphaproteobacteria bacterium]